VQVISSDAGETAASGCAKLAVTEAVATFVQPFAPVTVTVKLPAAFTVFWVEIFPPPQLKVAPSVVLDAVKTAEFVKQVNVKSVGVTVASG
jgi:hypothetical protein